MTWLPYELHPETPPEGVPLAERFPPAQVEKMYSTLRARGEEFDLQFGPLHTLPNSRLALETGEYARDRGCFQEFHEGMFRSYFSEGLDIGHFRVVAAVAARCGLDAHAVKTVLESKIYAPRLKATREEARSYGLTGIPTFIIGGRFKIVGAQPLENLRSVLVKAQDAYMEGSNE